MRKSYDMKKPGKMKRGRKPKVQPRNPTKDALEWLRISRKDAYEALKNMIEAVDFNYGDRRQLINAIVLLDDQINDAANTCC